MEKRYPLPIHLRCFTEAMVLAAVSSFCITYGITPERCIPALAVFAGVIACRTWSAGYICKEDRNLTNKTYILIGAFSGPGLALMRSLASRGCQIIALHPTPSSPSVLQLVLLLRATTGNERVYADECDITDVASMRRFVQRWEKDGRGGMVNDLEARIEGIIFCDGAGAGLEGTGMGVGRVLVPTPPRPSADSHDPPDELELVHSSLLLSRHCLTQLLLPALLRSARASSSPVRVISQISPFYAAAPVHLPDLDYSTRPFPRWQPWLAEGQASLASIALLRELQDRTDAAKPAEQAGLVVLSVCGGFTRAWCRRTLRAEVSHPHFSWIGLVAYLVLWPFIFLFAKTAEQASQDLLLAVLGSLKRKDVPVVVGDQAKAEVRTVEGEEQVEKGKVARQTEARPVRLVRGGAVYREGQEVRVKHLEAAGPQLGAKLWEIESKRVANLVARAAAEETRLDKEKERMKKENGGSGVTTEADRVKSKDD